uniref:Macro domain-containing protein n=1 Tax=Rodentolepis nana TaxID=102285 RepID=A0A0R3U080_RODNA
MKLHLASVCDCFAGRQAKRMTPSGIAVVVFAVRNCVDELLHFRSQR